MRTRAPGVDSIASACAHTSDRVNGATTTSIPLGRVGAMLCRQAIRTLAFVSPASMAQKEHWFRARLLVLIRDLRHASGGSVAEEGRGPCRCRSRLSRKGRDFRPRQPLVG
jgi:hypothetical protein